MSDRGTRGSEAAGSADTLSCRKRVRMGERAKELKIEKKKQRVGQTAHGETWKSRSGRTWGQKETTGVHKQIGVVWTRLCSCVL